MATDKYENDPFDKYDHLFEEQEKKYQKQNNSRYTLNKKTKQNIVKDASKSKQKQIDDKARAFKSFGLIFLGFIIIRIIMVDDIRISSFIIPFVIFSFISYSYYKNSTKR